MARVVYSFDQASKLNIIPENRREKPIEPSLIKQVAQKKNKYGNKKVVHGDEKFDSMKEYRRWCELLQLQSAGAVKNIVRQVTFPFIHNGVLICKYIADFAYDDISKGGISVVEDVKSKGTKTRVYAIKKKMMKAFYNIDILET